MEFAWQECAGTLIYFFLAITGDAINHIMVKLHVKNINDMSYYFKINTLSFRRRKVVRNRRKQVSKVFLQFLTICQVKYTFFTKTGGGIHHVILHYRGKTSLACIIPSKWSLEGFRHPKQGFRQFLTI